MSTLFLRTLREDPADADVDSAKLLQRAGYIRKAAPGIWTWLPLGLAVLNKIEDVIREEINGPAAARAVRGDPPLGGVRRQHLPPEGSP